MSALSARAALFDLDGTLVDSRIDIATAANAARQAIGLAALELDAITGCVGDGAARLIERVTPGVSPAQRAEAMAAFHAAYADCCCVATTVYAGVPELLDRLAAMGWKLGVATNKPTGFAQRILEHCGLAPLIAALRGGDGPRKPDPGQLLELFAAFSVAPAQGWMLGDHHTDIRAARAAGCRVLWCAWGFGARDGLAVDAEAASPAGVLTALAQES